MVTAPAMKATSHGLRHNGDEAPASGVGVASSVTEAALHFLTYPQCQHCACAKTQRLPPKQLGSDSERLISRHSPTNSVDHIRHWIEQHGCFDPACSGETWPRNDP